MLIATAVAAMAQCSFRNTAFKSGEFLSYNLYYNWKFVWVRVGTASMSIVQSKYNGQQAYRASLTTRGNSKMDKMFVMRDNCSAIQQPTSHRSTTARERSRESATP